MDDQQLDALLESAFKEGNSEKILNLPYNEESNYPLLEIVTQKINKLHEYLDSTDKCEHIRNILKVLQDFCRILKNYDEQSIVIAECMLKIAAEQNVDWDILNYAVQNLNLLIEDNRNVLNWLRNEISLEGSLLILGRKLPSVGDYITQSSIFEALTRISDDENKPRWIQSWFDDDEKTKSMFLSWNLDNFEEESRKILNHINRRELDQRTYAFAATAVYFGNVQLKKLKGLEFWIDFNYDSKSISFFCPNGNADVYEYWDVLVISSENVERYSVQKREDIKSIELCIILKGSCQDLMPTPVSSFQSNLVRMIFWIYVDISHHLQYLFGEPEILANDLASNSQTCYGSQRSRKASHSLETFAVQDQDDVAVTTKKIRKVSASDVVKIYAENYGEKKEKRGSQSTELVYLTDNENIYGKKKEKRVSQSAELLYLSDNEIYFDTKSSVYKNHNSSQKRKASCSSLSLKKSDSEKSYEMFGNNDVNSKCIKTNSAKRYFKQKEKSTEEADKKDTNGQNRLKISSQIFGSERKSSDTYCDIDHRSDNSGILVIDTDYREEGNFEEISPSILKENHEIVHEKHSGHLQTTSQGYNKDLNLTEEVKRPKSFKFDQDIKLTESVTKSLAEKTLQPNKIETNLPVRDSQTINSNESSKFSPNISKSISSEGSRCFQKKIKKVDTSSTKLSQSFSEETCMVSPTPFNGEKIKKTATLTSYILKDHSFSEAQNYFENGADAEKDISQTIFNEDAAEDFKNLNSSQSRNTKDDTPNNRQRKIRLYNIDQDPVYDVPPSQQKKVNDTPSQKNSPPYLSLKNQTKSLLQSSLPSSGDDFCEAKRTRKNSTGLLNTKKKSNCKSSITHEVPGISGENKSSENDFLEMGKLTKKEYKSSEQDTSENELHLSNKNAASKPRWKKLKKDTGVAGKRKPTTNSLLKRISNNVEDEAIPKKQRKAATKAMEKNKTILEEAEAEITSEVFAEKSSNNNLSDDKIEEVFCTPPTKPVKKRKLKSVFQTDTETGSSNVSWLGGKKSCLFETPEKFYSNRRKSKQTSKRTTSKKRTQKTKRKTNFSMNDFEIKSKSGLSDFENFELVVERPADRKTSSRSGRKHFTFENVSKAINAAMESCLDKQNSDDQCDSASNNVDIESRIHNGIPEFHYHEDLHADESEVNEEFITPKRNLTNINRKNLKSNIADESNTVKIKPKHSSLNQRHLRSAKLSFQEKDSILPEKTTSNDELLSSTTVKRKPANLSTLKEKTKRSLSNSELHEKTVSNDKLLSSSAKKRKRAHLSTVKENAKRKRIDSNNTQCINFDILTHTVDNIDVRDLIALDETSANIPTRFATKIPESPNPSEDENSSMSDKTPENHSNSSPKVYYLSEHSLSSLGSGNNVVTAKEIQMQKFLASVSGSASPNDFEYADIPPLDNSVKTLLSYKTSKSKKSSGSGYISKHSTSEKNISAGNRISLPSDEKNYMKKNEHFTHFDEPNNKSKASCEKEHKKFSLDNHFDSGIQEDSFGPYPRKDVNRKTIKVNGQKTSKQHSILRILGVEMDNTAKTLFNTLQKHFHDFNIKIAASRKKVLTTASALVSKENDYKYKDLKNMAEAYKMNRIQAEKSLNKILQVGQEYFEAEKMLDYKMKRLHKKALKKYAARIRLAGSYAVKTLEDRAAAKTEVLLKSILKRIETL